MRPPRCELCRYAETEYKDITLADYMMGRDEDQRYRAEFKPEYRENARELLKRVNALLQKTPFKAPKVSSGWRPAAINAGIGRPGSKHLTCQAIDIIDVGQHLSTYLMNNQQLLEDYDLSMESPTDTLTWCHLQSIRVSSGRRIFKP